MNRTDRLLAITLELQARKYTRAEDLADQFEVSVRTIYRDVLALCEAGIPVVSTPGYGYSLAPGYFLPPLMLTADEAGMLLLGAAFVADALDAPYQQASAAARKKIEKILPDNTRSEVEFLQNTMRFIGRARRHDSAVEPRLSIIRRAILDREVLRITYHARRGEPGAREVEPHGLAHTNGVWIMAAYCRLRQDMRAFRLDRMDEVTRCGETFNRRRDYNLHQPPLFEPGPEEVHILFDAETARWAREDRPFIFEREEDRPDGVVMVFRPRSGYELLPWVLSWGQAARVLTPEWFRRDMLHAAQAIVRRYADLPDNVDRLIEA